MKQRITLQDIADALNITKVTVSRALKGQRGVGDELRDQIEKKAMDLGYIRSSLHKSDKVLNFAFVTPKRYFSKTDQFYTDIFFTLHKLCDQKKHRVSLLIIDPEMEEQLELPNVLLDPSISGIFIGGEISKEYLGKIHNLDLPTVVIDYYSTFSNFIYLTVDNYYLGYQAATYLIEKGHKDIGFIGQKGISSNVTDRILGIEKALLEIGSTLHEKWTISNYDYDTALNTIDFELPDVLPTAFISHCDNAAFYFMEKLKLKGLKVPDDISILSFDNTEIALKTTPTLTSMQIDRTLFAEKGLESMEKLIETDSFGQKRLYLQSKLIERESVKSLKY